MSPRSITGPRSSGASEFGDATTRVGFALASATAIAWISVSFDLAGDCFPVAGAFALGAAFAFPFALGAALPLVSRASAMRSSHSNRARDHTRPPEQKYQATGVPRSGGKLETGHGDGRVQRSWAGCA